MNRKLWIAAAGLLVLLTILCIALSRLVLIERKTAQGQVGQREPLPGLGYCSSSQVRPCILSFNLDPQGGMVINLLAHGYSPDFYVKIRQENGERIYPCKKAGRYSIHVSCTGESMPVGEDLLFVLISTEENITLATGSFPIIGMALATPEVYVTPTHVSIFDRPPK